MCCCFCKYNLACYERHWKESWTKAAVVVAAAARIEERNVTFTLSRTILKDDPFSQLWGNINWICFLALIKLFMRDLNDKIPLQSDGHKWKSSRWPCNAMTEDRRYSTPEKEREGVRSGGRNSRLEWRRGQHFDTNSWEALKMTNKPAGWAQPFV